MQAAALPRLPVSHAVSAASKPSTGGADNFWTALMESLPGSAPVVRGQEGSGIKAWSKADPKVPPDEPAPVTEKQTADPALAIANPSLPVQLPLNLLQLAALQFTPLQVTAQQISSVDQVATPTRGDVVAGSQSGKDNKPVVSGEEGLLPAGNPKAMVAGTQSGKDDKPVVSGEEGSLPAGSPKAMVAQPSASQPSAPQLSTSQPIGPQPSTSQPSASQPQVLQLEDLSAGARETAVADDLKTSITPNEIAPAVVANHLFGKANKEINFGLSPAATREMPHGVFDTREGQEPPTRGAVKLPAGVFSEVRPQYINTSARIIHRPPTSQIFPPKLAPVEGKLSPSTEEAKVDHPSAKTEKAATENAGSAHQAAESIAAPSEPIVSEAVQLEPGTPQSPRPIKGPPSGTAASHKGASPSIADENVSAASSAAEIPAQVVGEGAPVSKTPRPVAAAAPTPAAGESSEKKSSATNPQTDIPLHELGATVSFAKDVGTTALVSTEGAPAAPPHESTSETREAPRAHQMLDSAPVGAGAPPPARVTSETGGEVQMHVGIRTSAFGAVEIYTSVHQNEVGLAVHSERGLSPWFSTEVQNIESGLKDHHLNLTTVEVDGGSTGLQTATSSHHHQPQRNSYAVADWRSGAMLEVESKPEPVEAATPSLAAWSRETRVSIHI